MTSNSLSPIYLIEKNQTISNQKLHKPIKLFNPPGILKPPIIPKIRDISIFIF